jgi:pimeloyl-ACP methyl ester carboxylesterase
VRWGAILLLAAPVLLLLLAGGTAASGHSARSILRGLRFLIVVDFLFLFVLAVIGATYEARSRKRDRRLYQPPGRLIDMGGYKLHLYCSGSGSPTVVLDYGLQGSYLDWRSVQPEVARFTRVCSYDRGGYGWSDPSPKPRTLTAMMEELHALLAAAGEKPPYILVGHSYGGFDVVTYAHQFRDETAAVMLVDSSHPDYKLSFDLQRKLWLRLLQYSMPFGLPRWRGWCGDRSSELGQIRTSFSCQSHVPATAYAQWILFDQSAEDVRNLGSLGNIPLVVVARDPNRPQERQPRWRFLQEDLLKLSTNSTLVIAEGSSHDVPGDRPDVVVEAIKKLALGFRLSAPRND